MFKNNKNPYEIKGCFQMEQVMGIEPTSQPWQGHVLAVVLHLHKYGGPSRI